MGFYTKETRTGTKTHPEILRGPLVRNFIFFGDIAKILIVFFDVNKVYRIFQIFFGPFVVGLWNSNYYVDTNFNVTGLSR